MQVLTNLKFGIGMISIFTITNAYSFYVFSKFNDIEKLNFKIKPK
jgi:hypothetical protein